MQVTDDESNCEVSQCWVSFWWWRHLQCHFNFYFSITRMKVRSPGLSVESAVDCVTVIATAIFIAGLLRSDGRKSPTRPWGSVFSMEPGLRSNPIHSLCLTLRLRNLPWEPLMLATSLANNESENRRATGKQVRVHGHRSWWHWREMFTTGRTTILG